jgi:AbrB family looped-hinge helix DNA binding protein
MDEFISSVSPKGQITLPVAVRKRLGIKPKDKVSIRLEGDRVVVEVAKTGLMRWYQSVPALAKPLSLRETEEIAAEESIRSFKEGKR